MKDAGVAIDYVVEIDVPDAAIVERMSGRRVHLPFGPHLPRQVQPAQGRRASDDITGEPLIQRDDDREDTVKKRLAVYHRRPSRWSPITRNGRRPATPARRSTAGSTAWAPSTTIRDAVLAALKS